MSDVQRRSYSPNIAKENLLNVCLALVTELRGFMPACPARLRLLSGSCSSAHSFAPRFLHAGLTERRSAVCFARYDQLAGGLPPPSRRPCWAHITDTAGKSPAVQPSRFGQSGRSELYFIPVVLAASTYLLV